MRKIIVFENMTVNGFMADSHGKLDWALRNDEITKFSTGQKDSVDTFIFGRVTYDMMAGFWPTPVGKSASPIFADILNKTPKIVFSRTLSHADWNNTKIMHDISITDILKLKQSPGKNMMIFGSGTIVNQFTKLGLIDEYQLLFNPVISGEGKPLFKDSVGDIILKLIDSKNFKSGIVLLIYQPVNHI
jgi:dihydrofolate reductase